LKKWQSAVVVMGLLALPSCLPLRWVWFSCFLYVDV